VELWVVGKRQGVVGFSKKVKDKLVYDKVQNT
jgi:hypothetical protein